MFKVKLSDYYHHTQQKESYCIIYETTPDISKGAANLKFHQSVFTNRKKALAVASSLGCFLEESFLFLDLIYLKLKSLENAVFDNKQYLKIDFNRIENARFKILATKEKSLFACEHINNISDYINQLKYWCFAINEVFAKMADSLFKMLISFQVHFINTYRSSEQLHETKNLNLF